MKSPLTAIAGAMGKWLDRLFDSFWLTVALVIIFGVIAVLAIVTYFAALIDLYR